MNFKCCTMNVVGKVCFNLFDSYAKKACFKTQ